MMYLKEVEDDLIDSKFQINVITSFRYVPGVGQVTAEDTIRREIIHLVMIT